MTVEVSRFCGVENRGIYFLAVLGSTMAALIGDLGLSMAALAFGAARRTATAHLHALAVAASALATAVGALAVFGLESFWTRTVLKGLDREMLVLLVLGIAPLLYSQIAGALLTGLGQIPALTRIRVGASALAPVLMLAALWPTGGSPHWAVAAWLGATVVLAAWMASTLVRQGARPARPALREAREVIGFGLRGQVGTVAHYGFLRTDVLFLSARAGPAAVGLYSLASVLAEKISIVGHALYAASASRIGGGPRDEATELTAALLRTLLLVLVPTAIVVGLVAKPFIGAVCGESFEPAATPFVLLLPGTVCLTLWYVVSLYLVAALGRPGLTTVIQASALVLSIPMYYVAVERWGMNGAAVVSSGVYGFVLVAGIAALLTFSPVRLTAIFPRGDDARLVWRTLRRAAVVSALRRGRA